jgi:hypothetical protein
LRSAASFYSASLFRPFRTTLRYGAKRFALGRGIVCAYSETGAVSDDGTIDRLPRGEAASAVNEWEFYLRPFAASRFGSQLLMRRKGNGEWQYRSPTPKEEADYVASEGW